MIKSTCKIGQSADCDICIKTTEQPIGFIELSVKLHEPPTTGPGIVRLANQMPQTPISIVQRERLIVVAPGDNLQLEHGDTWELHGRKFRWDYNEIPTGGSGAGLSQLQVGPPTPVKPFQLPSQVNERTPIVNSPFKVVQPIANNQPLVGPGPIGPQISSLSDLLRNISEEKATTGETGLKIPEPTELHLGTARAPVSSQSTGSSSGIPSVGQEFPVKERESMKSSSKPSVRDGDVFVDAPSSREPRLQPISSFLPPPTVGTGPLGQGGKSPRLEEKKNGDKQRPAVPPSEGWEKRELKKPSESVLAPTTKEKPTVDIGKMAKPEINAQPLATTEGHMLKPVVAVSSEVKKEEKKGEKKEVKPELKEVKKEFKPELKVEEKKEAKPELKGEKKEVKPELKVEEKKEVKPAVKEVKPVVKEAKPAVKEIKPETKEIKPEVEEIKSLAKEIKQELKEVKPAAKEVKPTTKEEKQAAKEEKPLPKAEVKKEETKKLSAKEVEPSVASKKRPETSLEKEKPSVPSSKLHEVAPEVEKAETPKKKAKPSPKKQQTPSKAEEKEQKSVAVPMEEVEEEVVEQEDEEESVKKTTPKKKTPAKTAAKTAAKTKETAKASTTPKSTRKRRTTGGEEETPTMRTRSRK